MTTMTEQERTELQQQFCIKTIQDMTEEDLVLVLLIARTHG